MICMFILFDISILPDSFVRDMFYYINYLFDVIDYYMAIVNKYTCHCLEDTCSGHD